VYIDAVTVPHCEWQALLPAGWGGDGVNTLVVTVGGAASAPVPYSYAKPEVFSIQRRSEASIQEQGRRVLTTAQAPPSLLREEVIYVCGVNFGGSYIDAASGNGEEAAGGVVSVLVRGVSCPGVRVIVAHCKLRVPLPAPLLLAFAGSAGPSIAEVEVVVAGLSSR
jgi:hypothetical protein